MRRMYTEKQLKEIVRTPEIFEFNLEKEGPIILPIDYAYIGEVTTVSAKVIVTIRLYQHVATVMLEGPKSSDVPGGIPDNGVNFTLNGNRYVARLYAETRWDDKDRYKIHISLRPIDDAPSLVGTHVTVAVINR